MTEVLLHEYQGRLFAVEHIINGKTFDDVVLLIGGLGNGLTDIHYIQPLKEALGKNSWGLVAILTSSSYRGWGTGSIARDAQEITALVKHLISIGKKRIVLLGHSTGTQDIIYYLTQQYPGDDNDLGTRPKVTGVILQASVSDRDGYVNYHGEESWKERLDFAKEWVKNGRADHVLPPLYSKEFSGTPITAERWVSLQEVRGGEDFFSTDLNDDDFKKTFGKISVPLLVAYGENDQYTTKDLEVKKNMVEKFKRNTDPKYWSEFSGLVKCADHAVIGPSSPNPEVAIKDFLERVTSFLESL